VTEVIELPEFDAEMFVLSVDPTTVKLGDKVMSQLREYVTIIASSYRDNPFHNYEHACHVQTSIVKLLQRVTTPEQINYDAHMAVVASDAHDYTYGIASDALTQFAVVFCRYVYSYIIFFISSLLAGSFGKSNQNLILFLCVFPILV
jgi:hypothetical protein